VLTTSTDWVDEPIAGSRDDRLGRVSYATHIASLIADTHSLEASVVYGLSGPWGSGKTSLSNMVVEQLSTRPGAWRVARFTPWAASDVNGMLAEFYRSIAHALPDRKGAKKARRALGRVAQVSASAVEGIPVAGGPAAALLKTGGDMLLAFPPWDIAFQKATDRIRDLGVPVLVVVDDIDRLHSEELTALLKVVRLLGRFPGVDYLLAYDNSTVFAALDRAAPRGQRDGTSERFMEKIVQFPIAVPPLLHGQQLRLLNDGFARVFAATGRVDRDDRRLSNLLSSFTSLLTTPRAIERYIAQVQHQLSILPAGEIDDTDLIILTLIRVALPSVFEVLPRYRGELLSGHTDQLAARDKRHSSEFFERFEVAALFDGVPEGMQSGATELVLALFPRVADRDRITINWTRSARTISADSYFDRYFYMAIADNDVSDVDLRRAVTGARQGDSAALDRMLNTDDVDRLLLVLGKVRAEIDASAATPTEVLNLAGLLADRLSSLPDPAHVMFSPQDLATNILVDMLARTGQHFTHAQIEALLARIDAKPMELRVWDLVGRALREKQSTNSQPWFDTVNDQLADEAVVTFIGNLRAGDAASTDDGAGTSLHFALDNGRGDDVRTQVQQLLSSGAIDVGTLAARFVPVRRLVNIGATWRLADEIDQKAFDLVAPPDDDAFYHLSPSAFESGDLTWTNRRLAAAGRTRRPPDLTQRAPDAPD